MKVALCKSRFVGPVSGADETLVTYALQLRDAGHDVRVVILYPHSARDPYYQRLTAAGIPVATIVRRAWIFSLLQFFRRLATHALFVFVLVYSFASHMRGLWTALLHAASKLYYRRCVRFFSRNSYDVVHILTPDAGTPMLIAASRAAGHKTLYQELGSPHHPDATRHYRRLARAISQCAEVTALSPKLAEEWTHRFPLERPVGVMPLIVDRPSEWRIPRRPLPYGPVFGYSGRLERLKGVVPLLEAFSRLQGDAMMPFLRIAGEGPEAYKVRRLAHELGIAQRCDFLGRYAELDGRSAFFGTLDIFVLSSLTEGTPNSVIEAMASGLPVIASAVGGIPDMIDEDSGILVPPGDPGALAAAMSRLIADPALRRRMGAAAKARYERLFSAEAALPVLVACYERMQERTAGAPALSQPVPARLHHPWAGGRVVAELLPA